MASHMPPRRLMGYEPVHVEVRSWGISAFAGSAAVPNEF